MYRAEGSITFSLYNFFCGTKTFYSSEEKKFRILNKVARKPNIFWTNYAKFLTGKLRVQSGRGISTEYHTSTAYFWPIFKETVEADWEGHKWITQMRKLLEAYFILGTEQTTLVLALTEQKKCLHFVLKWLAYGLLTPLSRKYHF